MSSVSGEDYSPQESASPCIPANTAARRADNQSASRGGNNAANARPSDDLLASYDNADGTKRATAAGGERMPEQRAAGSSRPPPPPQAAAANASQLLGSRSMAAASPSQAQANQALQRRVMELEHQVSQLRSQLAAAAPSGPTTGGEPATISSPPAATAAAAAAAASRSEQRPQQQPLSSGGVSLISPTALVDVRAPVGQLPTLDRSGQLSVSSAAVLSAGSPSGGGGNVATPAPHRLSRAERLTVHGTRSDGPNDSLMPNAIAKLKQLEAASAQWPEVAVTWYEVNTESVEAGFTSHAVKVRIDPESFGKGAFRTVHYMSLKVPNSSGVELFVIKCATETEKSPPDVAQHACFSDVRMQSEAGRLARLYNRVDPPKEVHFLPAAVVFFPHVDQLPPALERFARQRYAAIEPLVPGEYQKWSNNLDYVSPFGHQTPVAFSHFTFEATNGECLVCDIQGVQGLRGAGYFFTDPQIHGTLSRWGNSDLGREGIKLFFTAHKCNDVCRLLGLTPSNSTSAEVNDCPDKETVAVIRRREGSTSQPRYSRTLGDTTGSSAAALTVPAAAPYNVSATMSMTSPLITAAAKDDDLVDGSTTNPFDSRRRPPRGTSVFSADETMQHAVAEAWLDLANIAERARANQYVSPDRFADSHDHENAASMAPAAVVANDQQAAAGHADPTTRALSEHGGQRVTKAARYLWGQNAFVTIGHHALVTVSRADAANPALDTASVMAAPRRIVVEAELPEYDDAPPIVSLRDYQRTNVMGDEELAPCPLEDDRYLLLRRRAKPQHACDHEHQHAAEEDADDGQQRTVAPYVSYVDVSSSPSPPSSGPAASSSSSASRIRPVPGSTLLAAQFKKGVYGALVGASRLEPRREGSCGSSSSSGKSSGGLAGTGASAHHPKDVWIGLFVAAPDINVDVTPAVYLHVLLVRETSQPSTGTAAAPSKTASTVSKTHHDPKVGASPATSSARASPTQLVPRVVAEAYVKLTPPDASGGEYYVDKHSLRLADAHGTSTMWFGARFTRSLEGSTSLVETVHAGLYGVEVVASSSSAAAATASSAPTSTNGQLPTISFRPVASVALRPDTRKAARGLALGFEPSTRSLLYSIGTPAVEVIRLSLLLHLWEPKGEAKTSSKSTAGATTSTLVSSSTRDRGAGETPTLQLPHATPMRCRSQERWVGPVTAWAAASAIESCPHDAIAAVGYDTGEIVLWCAVTGVVRQFLPAPTAEPRVRFMSFAAHRPGDFAPVLLVFYSNGQLVTWEAPVDNAQTTTTVDGSSSSAVAAAAASFLEHANVAVEPRAVHKYDIGMGDITAVATLPARTLRSSRRGERGGNSASADFLPPTILAFDDGQLQFFDVEAARRKGG